MQCYSLNLLHSRSMHFILNSKVLQKVQNEQGQLKSIPSSELEPKWLKQPIKKYVPLIVGHLNGLILELSS